MTLRYTVRPLSDRTWLRTKPAKTSQFTASWSDTLDQLEYEIGHLKGRDIVIEIDVAEKDLKLDGTLRANARPTTNGVVVAFESKHGPLLYRCDSYVAPYYSSGPSWQHNVRAITLTLAALRAVDRYGATETGQQYTGYKALPAGRAMPPSHMTTEQARAVLVEVLGEFDGAEARGEVDRQVRRAKMLTHPDRCGGDRSMWNKVEQAAAVLLR